MSEQFRELLSLLESTDVRERIGTMVQGLDGVSEHDGAQLIGIMDERLAGIASSLRDVCIDDDVSEAVILLPWIFLELRFEWMRYNTQMQYQTITRGAADPVLMARGAALSFVLEAVEMHLDSEAAFVVTKIAGDPAGTARGAAQRTDRLFELMTAASAGGRAAVQAMLVAQDQIRRHTDQRPVEHAIAKAISTAIEKIGLALRVSVADFAHALEGVLLRRLGDAPVRVVLEDRSPDASLSIPSAVANGFLRAASDWMDTLRQSALLRNADARLAAGMPAHVTLCASLHRAGDRVELSIRDDADGTADFRPASEDWPVPDLEWKLDQQEGQGRAIAFSCYVTGISEYMVLRVGSQASDALVCVPLHMVDRIERRDASALTLHGTRVIDRLTGGTAHMLDLGRVLFGTPIHEEDATYVYVRPEGGGSDTTATALRVRAVTGSCRGSLKTLPAVLAGGPLRGFVQSGADTIGILDFERILQAGNAAQAMLHPAAA